MMDVIHTSPLEHALVIIGRVASGKSTVGRLLSAKLSCSLISFGSYVRDEAVRRGLSIDHREDLERLGASIVASRGHERFLADVLHTHASVARVVLEGVRHVGMLQAVRQAYPQVLSVYLDVPPDIRYKRWLLREQRADTAQTRAAFDAIAGAEVEHNVRALIGQVDQVLDASRPASLIATDILSLLDASRY